MGEGRGGVRGNADNGWGYEKLPKAICAEGVQPLEPHIRMLSSPSEARAQRSRGTKCRRSLKPCRKFRCCRSFFLRYSAFRFVVGGSALKDPFELRSFFVRGSSVHEKGCGPSLIILTVIQATLSGIVVRCIKDFVIN